MFSAIKGPFNFSKKNNGNLRLLPQCHHQPWWLQIVALGGRSLGSYEKFDGHWHFNCTYPSNNPPTQKSRVFATVPGGHMVSTNNAVRNTKRHCWKNAMPNSKRQHTRRGRWPLEKMARNRSFCGGWFLFSGGLGGKDGPNSKWMKTSKKDWASQAKKLDEWNLEDLTRANAGVFFLCLPNLLTSPFRILLPISHHQPAAVYP